MSLIGSASDTAGSADLSLPCAFDDPSLADRIASACYRSFSQLPKKALPQVGVEWALLAGVVMTTAPLHLSSSDCVVVALGTGSKCLGASQLCRRGRRLSDSHAEVVARRCFRRFLLAEARACITGRHSDVFCISAEQQPNGGVVRETAPLSVRSQVNFHFFTSHTPCGDCSIFPKRQRSADCDTECDVSDTPAAKVARVHCETGDIYRTGAKPVVGERADRRLPGAEYHVTGVLRNKPGRGEPTLSHCCSDKMARWMSLGMEGALLAPLLCAPVRLHSLVIGAGPCSTGALRRGLVERAPVLQPQPRLIQSRLPFPWSRHSLTNGPHPNTTTDIQTSTKGTVLVPSPCSVAWTGGGKPHLQVLVEGWLQGCTKKQRSAGTACAAISRHLWAKEFLQFLLDVPRHLLPHEYCKLLDSSEKQMGPKITYDMLKAASSDHSLRWRLLRYDYFSNWVTKPVELMSFTVEL